MKYKIINLLFLELLRPLLSILASEAAKDGFSATIKAVFMIADFINAKRWIIISQTRKLSFHLLG